MGCQAGSEGRDHIQLVLGEADERASSPRREGGRAFKLNGATPSHVSCQTFSELVTMFQRLSIVKA